MRAYNNGSFFTVTVSKNEIAQFASRWPCFGQPRKLFFEFDKRNGDLVGAARTEGLDGHGVLALADDARAYGKAKLGLV